jgi:hypothetical protein
LTKLSDNNNPLPRDRVIFDYDYFDNTPLSAQGVNVHRFSPGFEMTFLDHLASIEVRVPFASTLSSDAVEGGVTNTGQAELGDVHLTLKGLLYHGDVLNVCACLGIDLPTARDTRLRLEDGTILARIRNDSVLLTPCVAYLLTPCDRLFFQNWYEFVFDTKGSEVQVNPDLRGLQNIGRLRQHSLLEIDAQVGYWVYRAADPCAWLGGLAPFIELHYNSTMQRSNLVQGEGFAIGMSNCRFDELNLTAGVLAPIHDNVLLTVGVVAPLRGQGDRSFDFEIGVHATMLIGPTSRNRSAATPASSF